MVIKMRESPNILNLLKIPNRRFAEIFEKCLNIGRLSLIARPSCGRLILPKQTNTTTRSLACLSYTKFWPNSKTNLLRPEKALNAAAGSSIRSWRSWCRLLHRKRPIYFDVFTHCSASPVSAKSAFTPSWLHPRFPGNDCGKGFGR
jgi:hypothetical protein